MLVIAALRRLPAASDATAAPGGPRSATDDNRRPSATHDHRRSTAVSNQPTARTEGTTDVE